MPHKWDICLVAPLSQKDYAAAPGSSHERPMSELADMITQLENINS